MGLDLTHAIPSARTADTLDYFTLDELEDRPDFIEKYTHLFTEIEVVDSWFEVVIFPDQATKDLMTKQSGRYVNTPTLVGNVADQGDALTSIAAANGIHGIEPSIYKHVDNLLTRAHAQEIYSHSAYFELIKRKIKVLYFQSKGYQRKGMSAKFYEDFRNSKLYFDKDSVLKAILYLEPTRGDDLDELKQHFQTNFIDNFVEGESIFCADW